MTKTTNTTQRQPQLTVEDAFVNDWLSANEE
jgi:hypothetical protein